MKDRRQGFEQKGRIWHAASRILISASNKNHLTSAGKQVWCFHRGSRQKVIRLIQWQFSHEAEDAEGMG